VGDSRLKDLRTDNVKDVKDQLGTLTACTDPMRLRLVPTVLLIIVFIAPLLIAQNTTPTPRIEWKSASRLKLPGEVDSNSPAVWDRVRGQSLMFVMTSWGGEPSTAVGFGLTSLTNSTQAVVDPWPGGGVWMEAVLPDDGGTWYGYYHNETQAAACGPESTKVIPRIGAARSTDFGTTWEPLGNILEAPPRSYDCETHNMYFAGGVGDLSVQLDPESQDLYIFYSEYIRAAMFQGVGVARLAWADRDDPVGKVMVWNGRTWLPPSQSRFSDSPRWIYPAARPFFRASEPWHDDDTVVDAFWGPSVHWNTYLQQYVMLLNHAKNENFDQEGIYISYSPRLDDPSLWSEPVKIFNGGSWYPQVMGLEIPGGSDKVAGQTARFFMSGVSNALIQFSH
jgi:hypothetical protein